MTIAHLGIGLLGNIAHLGNAHLGKVVHLAATDESRAFPDSFKWHSEWHANIEMSFFGLRGRALKIKKKYFPFLESDTKPAL
ncbi:MAG: hypothetical protein NTZ74_01425 [Chloroflexi bacterium]|nr:hypothetical protein [Chloroflexota bacterium]